MDRMPHNEEMVRGSDTAAMCRSRKGLEHTFVESMQDAGCPDSANLLELWKTRSILGNHFPSCMAVWDSLDKFWVILALILIY